MRFPLPAIAFVLVALAGCSSPQQKQARLFQKQARLADEEDTRATEQRRMFAMENGQANSARGASILYPSKNQVFDPASHTATATRGFETKGATTRDFYSDRQTHLDAYQTRDFYDNKPNSAAQQKFATSDANTKGKHVIPNVGKAADTKTAATKELWDANKVAASRALPDGKRQFLGKESEKLGTTIPAKDLANAKNGEAVVYSDGTIERISTLKSLSIDDIRELLNKSK